MTLAIITDIENLLAKLKADTAPEVAAVETDVEAAGSAAWAYIKANGLTDLIAIAKSALLGVATGTSYATILATVVTEGESAGITIAKGAESIVVAAAQADLIAVGQLPAPSTGTTVASPPSA